MNRAAAVCSASPGAAGFDSTRLERVFNDTFERFNTRLTGGAQEPLYQPAAVPGGRHCLYYREDFFASALHEAAHWCIAGEARRAEVDFGYWYSPDDRDEQAQRAFESVEVKPQALEWFFSLACGYPFRVSLDNLSLGQGALDASDFERRVLGQALQWQRTEPPARGAEFFRALAQEFGTSLTIAALRFSPLVTA